MTLREVAHTTKASSRGSVRARDGTLRVTGATLYYKLRGTGPLLLILPGGDSTADTADGFADHLVDRYTVLTHDRRGLSRSTVDDKQDPVTIGTHADDVHHLLASVAAGPAIVVGNSIGALIGLDLVSRYPQQVRLLVAHEAPASQFLPPEERAAAFAAQEEVEGAYNTGGLAAAMPLFFKMTGLDLADTEPGAKLPALGPEREANLRFFLDHDAPAVRRCSVDASALFAVRDRIVPAAGKHSRGIWPYRAAQGLAEYLDIPLFEFPGGHQALVFRPRSFAERLEAVLAGRLRP